MAKTFINEEDIVKLQILNLAVKLYLNNPEQTRKFCQYVFQLAKYDQNYDIRDRARFLKYFIFEDKEKSNKKLLEYANKIFLAHKPAPTLTSRYKDIQFQLGTLSHYLDMPCSGYRPLPPFPDVPSDPSLRDVPDPTSSRDHQYTGHASKKDKKEKKAKNKEEPFYSNGESTPEGSEYEGSNTDDSNTDSSEEENSNSSNEESSTSKKSETEIKKVVHSKKVKSKGNDGNNSSESSEDSDSDETSSEDSDSDSNSDEETETIEKSDSVSKNKAKSETANDNTPSKSNLDLLLELDDILPMTPIMTPSFGGFLSPVSPSTFSKSSDDIKEVPPSFIPIKKFELLNKVSGYGLELEYRFTRSEHLVNSSMVNIELIFCNESTEIIKNIRIGQKHLSSGMSIYDFTPVAILNSNASVSSTIGIHFNDSTQPVSFDINFTVNDDQMCRNVNIKAPIGEIVRSINISEEKFLFEKDKLKGMNEYSAKITYSGTRKALIQQILEAANFAVISSNDDTVRFAAHTLASKSLVLITIKITEANILDIYVNCEKMIIGSMLLNELKSHFK